ncbi:hypothetical protein EJB05_04030 [Eragrostis curvula]|uniref:DUF506 domain-containing protein n=1 Tax=Eragrostis curvula TaxID=38414 RepID=A0A5J9W9K7_9POAL|nr:hypothetical protein EJB05_04030 [Eragrostis curvula]
MEEKPPPPPPQPQQHNPAMPRVSRFRRLLVRVSASEKLAADGGKERGDKDEKPPHGQAPEVGSVGLDRMVLSFMEESGAAVERPQRGRCSNCFNGSNQEESDDEEFDFLPSQHASAATAAAVGDALDSLKGLVQSASVLERNLLADASRLAERCRKGCKGKAECRRAVADGLRALGYDAAVCKSRWDKAPTYPAGEHEYIDAVVGAADTAPVRLIVEVDFRSQFELARSTKAYRAALQLLPPLFVGTPERLGKIVAVVAEAARQSLKKKGLHFPPWRKPEYTRAKWLSPHSRVPAVPAASAPTPVQAASFSGEFELVFDRKPSSSVAASSASSTESGDKITVVVSPWRPTDDAASKKPQQAPKAKVVTGLAAVL